MAATKLTVEPLLSFITKVGGTRSRGGRSCGGGARLGPLCLLHVDANSFVEPMRAPCVPAGHGGTRGGAAGGRRGQAAARAGGGQLGWGGGLAV